MMSLMVFCGWCGAFLKGGCLPASHGACPSCGERMIADATDEKITARFWPRATRPEYGCWLWQARLNKAGYGLFDIALPGDIRKRPHLAHVVAFWLATGLYTPQARAGLTDLRCVLHKCDTPACVRPDHLRAGTIADNNRDAAAKGHFSTPARRAAGLRNLGIYATSQRPAACHGTSALQYAHRIRNLAKVNGWTDERVQQLIEQRREA